VFESFPSTIAAHRSSHQISWVREVVSGMFTLGGWEGMDWREKVIVQNCGRALVKPENQPGEVELALK